MKFLRAASFYRCDVLILGGDLTGKAVVPILRNDDDTYETDILGQKFTGVSGADIQDVEARINHLGFYPHITSKTEWLSVSADLSRYDRLYEQLALERIKKWAELAKEKLTDLNTPLYVTGGNDDPQAVVDFLKSQTAIINSEDEAVTLGDMFTMLSIGFSNHTPWKTPRECSEEELAGKIEGLVARVADRSNLVFNFHVPPYKSSIDMAPAVDDSVDPPKYVLRNGMPVMTSVGSTAVRSAIEKYHPFLGLHGHIHESKGAVKIGSTLCVNPGSEYSEGILKGVILNLDEGGVKSYQFTSG
jgi:Icc-related predicted phosphoesterase